MSDAQKVEILLAALKSAYREISGDYTDGAPWQPTIETINQIMAAMKAVE